MIDPALAYEGPESHSQAIEAVRFDGSVVSTRGTIANAETSAGEAGAPFADKGALAWIAFDGDQKQIEFIQYTDRATGDHLHRRAIKAERVGVAFNTVKINMAADAAVLIDGPADWDAADFDPVDFNAA